MCIVRDGKALERIGLPVHERFTSDDLERDICVLRSGSKEPLKTVFDVGRRQGASVGENNAAFQGEVISETVFADCIVLAETPDDLGGPVYGARLKEAVEDVHGDHVVVGRLRHVHCCDVIQDSSAEKSLLDSACLCSCLGTVLGSLLIVPRTGAAARGKAQYQGERGQKRGRCAVEMNLSCHSYLLGVTLTDYFRPIIWIRSNCDKIDIVGAVRAYVRSHLPVLVIMYGKKLQNPYKGGNSNAV